MFAWASGEKLPLSSQLGDILFPPARQFHEKGEDTDHSPVVACHPDCPGSLCNPGAGARRPCAGLELPASGRGPSGATRGLDPSRTTVYGVEIVHVAILGARA